MTLLDRSAAGALAVLAAAVLAACGGGGNTTQLLGGNGYTAGPATTPAPAPTAVATGPTLVSGSVVSIPVATYGTAAPQTALAGATVVVGPVLVAGATPPASAPAGDVMVMTNASGGYSASIPGVPVAPSAAQATIVYPEYNILGLVPPAYGFYIAVFAPGADGKSAGAPLPVHAFSAVGIGGVLATQRVTVASSDEANFLTLVNADRAAHGGGAALPLIFDETAEEAARLHVNEEAGSEGHGQFYCHYNYANVGPSSRFLALAGLGSDDENIGKTSGESTAQAYTTVEGEFIAEGVGGLHYANIVDATRAWAGLAVLSADVTDQYVDQELDSPSDTGTYVYSTDPGTFICPPGVYNNGS